ncbi:F-BAR domain only protein 1 [Hemicordylus capensis]|uniref:F-BAR domain only protein 1 n=1 Tax=Hemicordylus capensis TaxID=884348 RepID=UPI002303337A|nr:F-BAR domain only protein 1 [Hemicordylus capensis]XP_053154172.1 F-BAR domain only protein 1 [Hemicordylus capensis]XP_053154173.1 F-BAR domain only protein 1 [Hemicordylus capensis]XP_053154174.1 F-BAR domain only protein 1 [Hemicordylus capensis]XP_053154175.1 F-BAR domain only protein 1 [Hemicordylus capensis]XP_053154176.1 F-BAR domain only protein 1 [Hemicordylus capensis]
MSYFGDHFWGEKNHGFDVLYHNMKHGQISAKELADFVRERAAVEESYAKSMVKMSKMAGNCTQLGSFAPLWEVFRISSDKLALCHAELVKKLQDLLKEIGRYGDEQLRTHKKSKDEVAGTLEAVQVLQGAAQHLPKAKETYHSRWQDLERLRREGASQKEIDKAELKSRKAVEALRRAVEKYNVARDDFEQKMLDSAVRFQEVEESHLEHMKLLIGSYVHSVEDTHVQIGQVHEEFKQNMENIGVETLLRNFVESKGTGRQPPGPLDFEELSMIPVQEGPKRTRSKAFRIPGLGRKERERDSVESPDADSGPPEVDEEGFTLRPDTNQNGEHSNRFCSSSDSDYDDEEPHKFYIRIKPVQPRERTNSAAASAAVEQLKASVGNLILPPSVGCTMKRHSSRHLKTLASAAVETDSDTAPAAGDKRGKMQAPHLAIRTDSCDSKTEADVLPTSALFGPPLESAFENEDFSAPRLYLLASSPSPFSSSSPENVEDSGLDSPSHQATGPSPDSRLWSPRPGTPQSPLGKRASSSSLSLRGTRPSLPAEDGPSPWLPQPASRDLPCFAAEPDWADSVSAWPAAPAHGNPPGSREESSPDPFSGEPVVSGRRAWTARPRSPASDCAPRACERDSCLSSNSASSSSSSPAPPSSGDSTSPSPWAPRGRDSESGTPAIPEIPSEPVHLPQSAPPSLTPMVAPPRRYRTKRPLAVSATCVGSETPRSLSPSPLWALSTPQSSSGLTERAFFMATQPGLGISRGPSPVVLGSQGALPVATAFTEYIHAYFKGHNSDSCLVKVTGELTMSFPAGIIRVFSSTPAPPVLSFRLLHTASIEQFLPNADLLFSDPSQSDPSSKDFWLNMSALTTHLQKQAEQAATAPYYNVTLLRYQYSKQGPAWAPLQLAVNWECASDATRVRVDYSYNAAALASAVALSNVQVLLPMEEPVANVRLQPTASWNLEEKRLLWRLLDVSGAQGRGGCGHLLASWEPLNGPSKPSPVAAQFTSEGSTVSGADVELVGSGYRMSLVKKRFATGIYLAGS